MFKNLLEKDYEFYGSCYCAIFAHELRKYLLRENPKLTIKEKIVMYKDSPRHVFLEISPLSSSRYYVDIQGKTANVLDILTRYDLSQPQHVTVQEDEQIITETIELSRRMYLRKLNVEKSSKLKAYLEVYFSSDWDSKLDDNKYLDLYPQLLALDRKVKNDLLDYLN